MQIFDLINLPTLGYHQTRWVSFRVNKDQNRSKKSWNEYNVDTKSNKEETYQNVDTHHY